ncbi:MAG: transporter substrate-binding domain-containing protein [Clostridiales bacterium]|nr:transporter substrate-binding domain-containing protein [Clostridiales bacterium]
MKKIIAILLAMVMLLAFVACGTKDEGGDSGEERAVLRVGMECGYAPYNWTQGTDENGAVPIVDSSDYAFGYDVMMAKLLADSMGCDLEIYKIDWDTLPMALIAGTIDCVIAGQSITSKRLETVDFTAPYYYASIVGLTMNDSDFAEATGVADLEGAICTSQLNTVWYDVCLPQIQNADILPAMESAPTMLVALSSGACNLVVTDEPTALAATVAYPNMVMLNFTGGDDNFEVSDEEINIGISVKKGNSELLEKLNAGLATLTTEDFTRMMDEAIAVQPLSN